MKKSKLVEIVRAYRPLGIVWGAEFLLSPDDALRFADALRDAGVGIMGVDGWRYVTLDDQQAIAQDLAIDFYVGEEVLNGDDPVEESVALIKEFITTSLHEHTVFVSFVLDIPSLWMREKLLDE